MTVGMLGRLRRPGWVAPLAVLAGLCTAAIVHLSSRNARLLYTTNTHDFGEVLPGQVKNHTFRLSATGLRPVRISRVVTSCGCLDADVRYQGRSLTLVMTMAMPRSLGPQTATAYVETDEAQNNKHAFRLNADVVEAVSIRPSSLNFGRVSLTDLSSVTIPVTLTKHKSGLGALGLEVVDCATPPTVRLRSRDGDSRLTLGLSSDAPVGPLTALLRVSFKGEKAPPIDYLIRGQIEGKGYATPSELFLTWDNPSRALSARTELVDESAEGAQSFEIRKVFGGLSDSACRAFVTNDGRKTFLNVVFDPSERWGKADHHDGVVQVKSRSGVLVNVPVIVNIK